MTFANIPRTPGIYAITNKANGHFYVGSAVDLWKRWSVHRSDLKKLKHHNSRVQAEWNKYGQDSFVFSVLEHVSDKAALLICEQKWLDLFNAGKSYECLNALPKAGSAMGQVRTKETCERISAALTGKIISEESKVKMRAAKLGKKQSPEHIAKAAARRKGSKINRPKGILGLTVRKFTAEQVKEMRRLKAEGWSYSQVMMACGVSLGGLIKIIKRQTYAEVADV